MKTIISLFSGCGGLDLGFKKAGFKTVLSTDIWDVSCKTIESNNLSEIVINDDIRNINFKSYNKKVDGVIGGPPCPPFSQSRHYLQDKKNGFEDEKAGFAVPEYFRVIKEVNPKFFLFENVDGFMYKTHLDALEFLKSESEKLGYRISYKVVNTANYGIPQTRKRFICVGIKKEYDEFIFPFETHCDPEKKEPKKENWVTCGEVLKDFDDIKKEELNQKPGSKHHHLMKDIPPGENYLFYTEKKGHPNPLFEWKSRYWTFLLKLSPDRPSWTIQASFSNNQGPFHWRNRFLRIEELKRIQTFDDDFELEGNFKEQWRQIGNAVPPKLAEIFATKIINDYEI
ncbi:DNA cytosine methyltransferase [Aquirufa sp. ROCK-SH2]